MMKKIFLYKYLFIIFVLCSFFLSFAKESLAVAPCGGFPNCGGDCASPRVCGTNWTTEICVCYIPTEPTATSAPSCRDFGNGCDKDHPCCSPHVCSATYGGNCVDPLPTATPTPTCKNLGQSCYNGAPCCDGNTCSSGYCVDSCDGSQLGYNWCLDFCNGTAGYADIGCWASEECITSIPPLYEDAPFPWANQWVGEALCPGPIKPPFCSAVTCQNVGTGNYCTIGPGAPFTIGCSPSSCDNCGGPDCIWCGGVPPPGGVVIPVSDDCYAQCTNAVVNPCITQTCPNSSCLSVCPGVFCKGTKLNDCACAANTCFGQTCVGTCGGVCAGTKIDESATACTGTQVQYTETPQTTGTIWAKATGCTGGVTSAAFPTWNSYNGQDDIVWYSGANQGSGTWQGTINISSHQPDLGSTINVHVYENGVCRPVGSGWKIVGGQTVTLTPKTCAVTINTSGAVSDKTNGINITATGNAHINPGSDSVRVWITRNDLGVIPGGVTYDYGGNPGIAAVEYDFTGKYYSLSNAYQNSVDAANTSATFTVHAPPGNYRVHCDLSNDLNGNLVKCSGNPTCSNNGGAGACAGWKSCSSNDWAPFRIVSPPTLGGFTIRRGSDWQEMPKDSLNRSQTCDLFLADTTLSRGIIYVAHVYDESGFADIGSVQIRWKGDLTTIMNMINMPEYNSGNNAVYYALVDLGADKNKSSVYGFEINMTSVGGFSNGWVPIVTDPTTEGSVNSDPTKNIERVLKVWDCQVPLVGTLYNDSSQSVMCTSDWAVLPKLSPVAGFNGLKFTNTTSPYPSVLMTPNSPAAAEYLSPIGAGLIWGKSYISVFNNGLYPGNLLGNLLASAINTKITDLGRSPVVSSCQTGQTFNTGDVEPYSTTPKARIDFSFIQDQEAWYQVEGAGVKSRLDLKYGVPVTADEDTTRFLTLGNLVNDNGLVSFGRNLTNTNGNTNDNEFGGAPPFKNWYLKQNTNDLDIYNYNYFYNNFYVKAGIGKIKTNSWDGWATDNIYFVNETLDINGDLIVPSDQTMMVIVKGDITIQPGVTHLDGIYIADGSITAGVDSATALTINGMLYAGGSVILNRSFTDKTENNKAPAVKVNYSPGLIFNLPPEVLRVLSGWREE